MIGQYLSTRGEQGYVVTDVSDALSDEAATEQLRRLPAHHLAADLAAPDPPDARATTDRSVTTTG